MKDFSKLACYKNTKNNKYRDIANEERYNEDWDKIVFAFIENGHGSHALAQKVTNKSYAYCGRIMDFLAMLGYIDTDKKNWKCIITKEEFEQIIKSRE